MGIPLYQLGTITNNRKLPDRSRQPLIRSEPSQAKKHIQWMTIQMANKNIFEINNNK